MNGKTRKLIAAFSRATRRNPDEVKRWFEGLGAPQRGKATEVMRAAVEVKPAQ